MKKILLIADAAAGLPSAPKNSPIQPATNPAAPAVPTPANTTDRALVTAEAIATDLAALQAIAARWNTAKNNTGQLQIAAGGLHRAMEFAQYHLNLAPAAPAPAAPVPKS